MTTFAPLLAGKCPADLSQLNYPVFASPKLDGIRAIRIGNQLLSRTLKPIPNEYVQQWCSRHVPEGVDGELVLSDWAAPFSEVSSAIMKRDGKPDFHYVTFDNYLLPGVYKDRVQSYEMDGLFLTSASNDNHWRYLNQVEVSCAEELIALDLKHQQARYEGTMVRDPYGKYKFGRSTTAEGILLKLKTFDDEEATIIGAKEEMHNANEEKRNLLGLMKRSTHKANKVPKGRLGAFVCIFKDGARFDVGSGLTDQQKEELWWLLNNEMRHLTKPASEWQGLTVDPSAFPQITVKHQPPPGGRQAGAAPRIPVFKGFRFDA